MASDQAEPTRIYAIRDFGEFATMLFHAGDCVIISPSVVRTLAVEHPELVASAEPIEALGRVWTFTQPPGLVAGQNGAMYLTRNHA